MKSLISSLQLSFQFSLTIGLLWGRGSSSPVFYKMDVSAVFTLVSIFFNAGPKSLASLYFISYLNTSVGAPFWTSTELQDILIDMLYYIQFLYYKMYNSEEVYTFEQNRQAESQPSSVDGQQQSKTHNSRPRNQLILGAKNNGISGTYTRIIPKRPVQDAERLYEQNMQLRERVKMLQEQSVKTKTRMSMVQREREQILTQLYHNDYGNPSLRDRRPSQKGLNKKQQKTVSDENARKILHSYKDQISKLKTENARVKKTVKYTQIQQMETQNERLHQQMVRMKKYMQDIIDNIDYDEYEKQIQGLNKQLQAQRESKKVLLSQMKKKDEDMEEVKNKIKIISDRKTELQKKFNRQISNYKGQLHRVKQKQREYIDAAAVDKKQSNKLKISSDNCKNCKDNKNVTQNLKKKVNELQSMLATKQKQLANLIHKNQQLEQKNTYNSNHIADKKEEIKSKIQHPKTVQNNQKKSPKKDITPQLKNSHKSQKKQTKAAQKKHQTNKKNEIEKQEQYSDLYEHDDQNQYSHQPGESTDKVDVFHVDLKQEKASPSQHVQKGKAKQNKKEKQVLKTSQNQYQDSFNEQISKHNKALKDNDSEQQVLFKKQSPEKQKQPVSGKKKQQSRHRQSKQKKQEKAGPTKAERILKQTIKYRFIAQRYTFMDFNRDIKSSQAQSFTAQELIRMLSNEPFFLNEEHLKIILFALFEKEQLSEQSEIKASVFLKKMKAFIGEFEIQDESSQQQMLKQLQSKLSNKKILQMLEQQADGNLQISKKGFVKVMKQAGLTDQQVQQCLAQASVLSQDIAHINYQNFLQKISYHE